MKRTLLPITSAAIAMAGLAACSAEDIGESIVERAIEAESGENVDLEFGDDGSFSVQTDEGEFSLDANDDGSFSVSGVGEDGQEFEVTGDNEGNISGGSDDESFSIEADHDDGTMTMETEDGVFESSSEIPDDFPADVPLPANFTVGNGSKMTSDDGTAWNVTGQTTGAFSDVADSVHQSFLQAGYTEALAMSQEGYRQYSYEGPYTVSLLLIADSSDVVSINIQVLPRN